MQMEKKNLNLKLVLKIFSLIQRNTMLVARTHDRISTTFRVLDL